MLDLRSKPFFLDDAGINWVNANLEQMTPEEKIGQLLFPLGSCFDIPYLQERLRLGIGGILFRDGKAEEIQDAHRYLQDNTKIPLLLAANLENGGTGIAKEGTCFGNPMQAVAANDPKYGYYLGKICCAEGSAVGINCSFAPIVDIDMNWRNPITNIRTFGSDPEQVLSYSREYIRAAEEEGVATVIKHFPGDGFDERDQHLHVTVNDLPAQAWMETYGTIYRTLIDDGAKAVMVAHICQPDLAKTVNPDLTEEQAYRPASLSPELTKGLLRDMLGFNGLVISDATPMLGFSCSMKRHDALPAAINAGVDMLVFNKNLTEDYEYLLEAYRNKVISDSRLNDAVTRILGFKASLKLHQTVAKTVPDKSALNTLRNEGFARWAADCADHAVTLVKDTRNILPITPERYPRIGVAVLDNVSRKEANASPVFLKIKEALSNDGYQVTDFISGTLLGNHSATVKETVSGVDLVLYVFNYPAISSLTTNRISWAGKFRADKAPWFSEEIPTIGVSFANPYHLIDVPQFHTYINAYSFNDYTVSAVVEKLQGKSDFLGKSPVDAFCGRFDTRF